MPQSKSTSTVHIAKHAKFYDTNFHNWKLSSWLWYSPPMDQVETRRVLVLVHSQSLSTSCHSYTQNKTDPLALLRQPEKFLHNTKRPSIWILSQTKAGSIGKKSLLLKQNTGREVLIKYYTLEKLVHGSVPATASVYCKLDIILNT